MSDVPFLDLGAATAELRDELVAASARVIDSGWYVLGAEVEAFEQEFANYCEVRHCVGVGNGLDALTLLLRAHGIGAGDAVVVPSHTFIATWLAVSACGATLVPAPVDEATGNLDPARLEPLMTERVRAIVAVHLYGQPADMTALRAIADSHSVLLLEDAAQAHGARWRGVRAGALADGAAFSFYPGKNLGAIGDAGAITTDDEAVATRCRRLRNYGSTVKYVHDEKGQNSRLDELQAALLRVKLAHLDDWNERRRAIAARYGDGVPGVSPLTVLPGADPAWHLYVIRSEQRDALQRLLSAKGVHTLVHYPIPPHRAGAYAEVEVPAEHVRSAERLSDSVLSLPIGPHMTGEQVEHVLAALASAASELARDVR